MGDVYSAAMTRFNAALLLAGAGRFSDALLYARAAQRGYAECHNAEEDVAKAQGLIDGIESEDEVTSPHPPAPSPPRGGEGKGRGIGRATGRPDTTMIGRRRPMNEAKKDAPVAGDAPVLGAMSPEACLAKLKEMDDPHVATLESAIADREGGPGSFGLESVRDWFGIKPPAYLHTTMAIGFLPPVKASDEPPPLRHAGRIDPEPGLRNQRITITLDRLRVADFPGSGMHHVLFDFRARNQTKDGPAEDVHFNTTSRVQEGEHAPVIGYPIFVGLRVGEDGVGFEGSTVNVKNENDELFLSVLESDAFKSGLTLVETVQPAIKPLSQIATGMATAIAKRNRNVEGAGVLPGTRFLGHRHASAAGAGVVRGGADPGEPGDGVALERVGVRPGQRLRGEQGGPDGDDPV